MKNSKAIYDEVIKPIEPCVPGMKRTIKQERDFNIRLISLIIGMVQQNEVNIELIKKFAKKLKV